MEQYSLPQLIEKYKAGQCSAAEIVLLHTWMEQLAAQSEPVPLPEATRQQVKDQVMAHVTHTPAAKIFSLRKWVAAAVLLPFIGALCWYLLKPRPVQWVCVHTGIQEVRAVHLPDSSTVWLNAASSLEYPAGFPGNKRLVKISGEAFFDVQPAADKPFIVQASHLRVNVLGTSFNVRQWHNEPLKVMVTTGKVQVKYDDMELATLTASGKLTYDPVSNHLTLDSTSLVEAKGWVNGEMVFTNASLREVLTELEAFYGVRFQGKPSGQGHFNVHFNQHMNLADKLAIIQKISITPAVKFIPADRNSYIVQPDPSKKQPPGH